MGEHGRAVRRIPDLEHGGLDGHPGVVGTDLQYSRLPVRALATVDGGDAAARERLTKRQLPLPRQPVKRGWQFVEPGIDRAAEAQRQAPPDALVDRGHSDQRKADGKNGLLWRV